MGNCPEADQIARAFGSPDYWLVPLQSCVLTGKRLYRSRICRFYFVFIGKSCVFLISPPPSFVCVTRGITELIAVVVVVVLKRVESLRGFFGARPAGDGRHFLRRHRWRTHRQQTSFSLVHVWCLKQKNYNLSSSPPISTLHIPNSAFDSICKDKEASRFATALGTLHL